jgi:hypothetical protein
MELRRQLVHFALVAVTSIVAVPTDAEPQKGVETNALWNDSGENKERGVWVYSVRGSCPEIRSRARPLVFGLDASPGKSEYRFSELRYCFAFEKDLPLKVGPRCKDGVVRLQSAPSAKQLAGTYAFTMEDGSDRSGSFVAAYCPKG